MSRPRIFSTRLSAPRHWGARLVRSDPRGVQAFELRTARPLEDSGLVFVREVGGAFERIAPPATGAALELALPEPIVPLFP